MIVQPQTVTQNDYGYELPFTLEDGNGNAVNLSGATLVLNVQDSQDGEQELIFSGGMTIDSASAGTCHYTVAQGNFPNPGTFLAQITATWPSSEVLTWSGITIIVEPALPKSNN
ncbi:MAG TPA: BppU family phage baseplate upper protein [Terracidiphilus sp.]|nr:BppU family phage baseplate upper protein [Terracidiphilus sp.]